ncbi:Phage virion morphogenesis family protein [Aneurinibacillus thermoaerophilus]|uniref:Phage virion morphogenesis family protein n=1 Tax=Aneurinibacillus thermoaerophilus TaxID=143495 RepID=A0A1G8EJW5_ANETH|nr:phage virion morphogenesis protein [Aneurinibacillus thermoaerophilus]SDH70233.1 Phage virion morphogenesis family protein [Aneurinibacillus thermoaerophilus]
MFNLSDIAQKFYAMSEPLHEGMADGVHKTAVRVMTNAKGRLGSYQEGWAILKDETVQRKFNNPKAKATGTDADAPLKDDGLLQGSITLETRRAQLESEVGSPMIYAATHEYGDEDRGIPERPYLRPALVEEVEAHLENDIREAITRRMRNL